MSNLLKIFKALSDTTRMDMIRLLLKKKELSCQELSKKFLLSQPALSHHFNKLLDAQVITVRKNGASHYYGVNKEYLKQKGLNIKIIAKKEVKNK